MQTQEENIDENPYRSPQSHVNPEIEEPKSYQGKVYNVLAIAIATLFGSVLAAGLLLHSNYTHFKQSTQAIITVLITIVATIAVLFTSLFVDYPSTLVYLGFNFLIAVILFPLCSALQGRSLDEHEYEDRPFHSIWRAALMGIACLLAMGMMLTFAYSMFVVFAL